MYENPNTNSIPSVNVTDDREARPKYWIAAYTRSRSEKKADKELRELGLEVFLPVQRQMRQWSDRKRHVDAVIIPMVIFLNVTDDDVQKIARHPLVLKLLSLPGEKQPAKIPLSQIERLKFILGQADIPVDYDPDIFRINDNVRVTRGKLMGLCGEVRSSSESLCELVIQIDILGGAILKIPKTDIEVIK